jgi:hypothetical protein
MSGHPSLLRYAVAAGALFGALALAPGAANAAPFCVQTVGASLGCLYADVAQCRAEARHLNGTCALNLAEVTPPAGERFCLVRNGPVIECLYPDRRSCETAATANRAICVDANPGGRRPDPDLIPR